MEIPVHTKKILYVVTQSVWGGAQRYVYDLATVFRKLGWQVSVATGEDPQGELCVRLQTAGVTTRHIKSLTRAVRPLHNIRAIFEITNLCRELKPDIVHLNSSMAGVVGAMSARLAHVPKIIYTVHGLVLKEPLPTMGKLIYWLAEWFAHELRDVTICVSEDDRRAAIRAHVARLHNTVTIPVGIDPYVPFLSKDEARKELLNFLHCPAPLLHLPPAKGETINCPLPNKGEDGGEGVWIGTIAGLYATKGLDTLLESARIIIQKNPEFHFIIIGEGPERKRLERSMAENKLQKNCHLLGHIPDAAMYLKAFDCFALPSLKEGLPYTILEARAAQIPIVATRVGGIPEIMDENETHRLIYPNNPAALTEAIFLALSTAPAVPESPLKPIPTLQTMIAATERMYLN